MIEVDRAARNALSPGELAAAVDWALARGTRSRLVEAAATPGADDGVAAPERAPRSRRLAARGSFRSAAIGRFAELGRGLSAPCAGPAAAAASPSGARSSAPALAAIPRRRSLGTALADRRRASATAGARGRLARSGGGGRRAHELARPHPPCPLAKVSESAGSRAPGEPELDTGMSFGLLRSRSRRQRFDDRSDRERAIVLLSGAVRAPVGGRRAQRQPPLALRRAADGAPRAGGVRRSRSSRRHASRARLDRDRERAPVRGEALRRRIDARRGAARRGAASTTPRSASCARSSTIATGRRRTWSSAKW